MAFILHSRLFLIFLEVGLALLGECVDAFFRFLGIVEKLDRVERQQADATDILTIGVEGPFGEGQRRRRSLAQNIGDRKSTRLNSRSLMRISYAVFCLKKK